MHNKMKPIFRGNTFALMIIATQFIGSIIMAYTIGPRLTVGQTLVVSQILFLICPVIIYFLVTKKPIKETLRLNKLYGSEIFFLVLIGILCYPIAATCSVLSSIFFQNNVQAVVDQLQGIPLISLVMIMALTPAICEEIVMRGIILSEYNYKSTFKAAIMTGLIFGMLHLSGQQFLYATILGFLFAYLVRITDSLFSTMIVHFVFNGFNVVLSHKATSMKQIQDVSPETYGVINVNDAISMLIPLIILSAIVIFIIVLMIKSMKNKRLVNKAASIPLMIENNIIEEDVMVTEGSAYFREGIENKFEIMLNIPFILMVIFNIIYIVLFS